MSWRAPRLRGKCKINDGGTPPLGKINEALVGRGKKGRGGDKMPEPVRIMRRPGPARDLHLAAAEAVTPAHNAAITPDRISFAGRLCYPTHAAPFLFRGWLAYVLCG